MCVRIVPYTILTHIYFLYEKVNGVKYLGHELLLLYLKCYVTFVHTKNWPLIFVAVFSSAQNSPCWDYGKMDILYIYFER